MSRLELMKSVINHHGYASVDRKNLEAIETEIRADIIQEVSTHLLEAGYTYDSNMGIGDNIGSALLEEYANGYRKGEQDNGTDERKKVLEEAYSILADELMWVLHEYGEVAYLSVGESVKSALAKCEKEQK